MAGNSISQGTSAEELRDSPSALLSVSNSATVFQCDSCLSIIGDSSSYVDLLEENGVIVLKPSDLSTSLKISSALSKNVIPGISGVSKKVFCAKCSQLVGAKYVKGLPAPFIHLKDCLCLMVDNVTSHKIPATSSLPVLNNESLMATLNYTIQEVAKLKHVMLNFNERLIAIEDSLQEKSIEDTLQEEST